MTADGVPPWARPVLEALREFVRASDFPVNQPFHGICQRATSAITAALASDAGTREPPPRGLRAMTEEEMAACEAVAAPEGEPFFHKLGCPKISGRGMAAHCTCPPDRERPEQTPAAESTTNAPETSTSLVHAAPDAELDRLLCSMLSASYDHARGHDHGDPLSCAQCQQWVEDVHAHVARREREARDNARAAAYAEITVRRDNERRAKEAPDAHP